MSFAHQRQGVARKRHGTEEIDFHGRSQRAIGLIFEGAKMVDTGVVDEGIEAPRLRAYPLNRRANLLTVGHIQRQWSQTLCLHAGDRAPIIVSTKAGENDPTGAREMVRRYLSDAAAAAGNQGDSDGA